MNIEKIKNTQGKILGVDFGDVRTGLAVSDPSRMLALCIETVTAEGIENIADKVASVALAERVGAIIVGLPVNMDGSEGHRAERARRFAALLEEKTGIPTETVDERMSTMQAARYLNATDTRGKKRKNAIDTLSAQIILQSALDRLKNQ
ncbi:MAG: Holliday junction resolvase RuvX [Ruminococcaceae bacterium]|nr:Holliday junction resolvase RuvX [Oscillospiraceae bacterium]